VIAGYASNEVVSQFNDGKEASFGECVQVYLPEKAEAIVRILLVGNTQANTRVLFGLRVPTLADARLVLLVSIFHRPDC
jgi:hypothetical protein